MDTTYVAGGAFNNFSYALTEFVSFLPSLLGAIVLLIVGWIISGIIAKLVEKVLQTIGLERAVANSGIGDFVRNTGSRWTASRIIAELVKWLIRLIFIQAAANALGMPQITAIINSIILFIPQVIVAIAIIVIGTLVAKFLAGAVRASLANMGSRNPDLFANMTRYAVIGFAVVAAVDQLGIAPTVVNALFIGLVGSIALAVGLAFGLGGKEVAAQITQKWYEKSQQMAAQPADIPPGAGGGMNTGMPPGGSAPNSPPTRIA